MKAQFTRWGLAKDYRGAQCTLQWNGRTLIGDIVDITYNDVRSIYIAKVKYFNGEPWPIDPALSALEILERTYE